MLKTSQNLPMATKLDSKSSNYFISIAIISSFYFLFFLREPMKTSFSQYVLWFFGFPATVYLQILFGNDRASSRLGRVVTLKLCARLLLSIYSKVILMRDVAGTRGCESDKSLKSQRPLPKERH